MIIYEKTVLCVECSATGYLKPEQSKVRTVIQSSNVTVYCCQHCTFLEVVTEKESSRTLLQDINEVCKRHGA